MLLCVLCRGFILLRHQVLPFTGHLCIKIKLCCDETKLKEASVEALSTSYSLVFHLNCRCSSNFISNVKKIYYLAVTKEINKMHRKNVTEE